MCKMKTIIEGLKWTMPRTLYQPAWHILVVSCPVLPAPRRRSVRSGEVNRPRQPPPQQDLCSSCRKVWCVRLLVFVSHISLSSLSWSVHHLAPFSLSLLSQPISVFAFSCSHAPTPLLAAPRSFPLTLLLVTNTEFILTRWSVSSLLTLWVLLSLLFSYLLSLRLSLTLVPWSGFSM